MYYSLHYELPNQTPQTQQTPPRRSRQGPGRRRPGKGGGAELLLVTNRPSLHPDREFENKPPTVEILAEGDHADALYRDEVAVPRGTPTKLTPWETTTMSRRKQRDKPTRRDARVRVRMGGTTRLVDCEGFARMLAVALDGKSCVFCGGTATSFGYFIPDADLARRLLATPDHRLGYSYATCVNCKGRTDETALIRDRLVAEAESLSGRRDLN